MTSASRIGFDQCHCFFVSTSFRDWLPLFLQDSYYSVVVDSLTFVCDKYDARLVSFVLMPNDLQLIVFFDGESALNEFMRDFKRCTSSEIRRLIRSEEHNEFADKLRFVRRDHMFKVWRERYRVVQLKDKESLSTKIHYIHQRPVQWGLCECAEDWKWSSAEWYANQTTCLLPFLDGL